MPPWSKVAAPVESCQSLPQTSPWGRLGSGLYMVSRLHRMRRRFEGLSVNSLNTPSHPPMIYLAMASRALGGPKRQRMRRRRLPTTRPTREAPPGADLPPKKACNLDPMAPRSRKKRKLPEAPSSRRSGLVGPYTTPPIVNYKYMTSTL